MNTMLSWDHLVVVRGSFAKKLIDLLKGALKADRVIPYLGPGLLQLNTPESPAPCTPED
ncbi:MAG: SIR2 family protein, partial [Mesorhizobium sp.]